MKWRQGTVPEASSPRGRWPAGPLPTPRRETRRVRFYAGIINLCHAMHFPSLPIKGNCDADKFKIYMADTGLLVAQLDDESQQDLRTNQNLGVYKGGLYENIVGDALAKLGYALAYYKKDDSTLEQDFFVRTATRLLPVEVKARGGNAQSLKTLIKSDHYEDIGWGVKLHGGNVGWSGRVLTLPYFTTFLLRRFLAEHGEDTRWTDDL